MYSIPPIYQKHIIIYMYIYQKRISKQILQILKSQMHLHVTLKLEDGYSLSFKAFNDYKTNLVLKFKKRHKN